MLTDIEISGFRGFADLRLSGLARVNLIVGRNNTGKTSFLEALALLAGGHLSGLPELFRANPSCDAQKFFQGLERDGAGGLEVRLSGRGQGARYAVHMARADQPISLPSQHAETNAYSGYLFAVSPAKHPLRLRAVSTERKPHQDLIAAFAEAVRPREGEAQMESLLAAVDPRIRTVRLDYLRDGLPFIVVDLGLSERIPLSQTGEGISRLVTIFSELLGQRPDIALIDEIENGIHHTALPQVWRGLAEVASRLDIQVFATTHSAECLAAAHEVFCAREPYDLRVIQLYLLEGRTEGRVLDQDHIAAALAGDIELR